MNYCEFCMQNEFQVAGELKTVLLDDNMETHLCEDCIDQAKEVMTVEILEET